MYEAIDIAIDKQIKQSVFNAAKDLSDAYEQLHDYPHATRNIIRYITTIGIACIMKKTTSEFSSYNMTITWKKKKARYKHWKK